MKKVGANFCLVQSIVLFSISVTYLMIKPQAVIFILTTFLKSCFNDASMSNMSSVVIIKGTYTRQGINMLKAVNLFYCRSQGIPANYGFITAYTLDRVQIYYILFYYFYYLIINIGVGVLFTLMCNIE